ncbi:hypothetical protein [Helicobacter heilmannii]|uniref:hypothetical protein n=1 Tax=Helicobacter heilmannii TaxID=35817 RepID=UPI00028B8467|nr:hypothetical protein [Helicobacter heilmannii]BDQ26884.1 hypothetical protein ASB1_05600 [Helicobacter heilmannii]BDQ27388.1 hypothetical protein ASB1_10640 [Helicobacter heilmannii]CCM11941.1 hypothetical protein BN341_8420 [Helicobacter heilmannii ASB1.4]
MTPATREKVKAAVGVFVAFALILSVAQNIHYFLKYNTSLEALLVCVGPKKLKEQDAELERGLEEAKPNKYSHSTTIKALKQDLINQAQKRGISKEELLEDIKRKLD